MDYIEFLAALLHHFRYETDPLRYMAGYANGFWLEQYELWERGIRDARICDATCAVMTNPIVLTKPSKIETKLTEDDIDNLMGALENMIAWTANPKHAGTLDFIDARDRAAAVLSAAINKIDGEV